MYITGMARKPAIRIRPRRTQIERSETTRAAILAAAMRCLTENGYSAATLARIALEAGVTRGALQHHFEDRRALMMSVVEAGYEHLTNELLGALPTQGSLRERVDRVVDDYLHHYRSAHARAAFEVVLAFREEPEFLAAHFHTLAPLQAQVEAGWRETFEDASISDATIYAARQVNRTSVLGFVLLEATGAGLTDPNVVKALKTSILHLVSTDNGQRPPIPVD